MQVADFVSHRQTPVRHRSGWGVGGAESPDSVTSNNQKLKEHYNILRIKALTNDNDKHLSS
jgi:hypothetical protein